MLYKCQSNSMISTAITSVVSWRTAVFEAISQVSPRVIWEFRALHSLMALLLASEAEALSHDLLFFFKPVDVWATVTSSHSVAAVTISWPSLEIRASSVRLTTAWFEMIPIIVAVAMLSETASITWAWSIPTTIARVGSILEIA